MRTYAFIFYAPYEAFFFVWANGINGTVIIIFIHRLSVFFIYCGKIFSMRTEENIKTRIATEACAILFRRTRIIYAKL